MANKITNFTVHRNNMHQRFKKSLRQDAVKQVKKCMSEPNIAGYAIVTWTDNGGYNTAWNTGKEEHLTAAQIPEYIKFTLTKELIRS